MAEDKFAAQEAANIAAACVDALTETRELYHLIRAVRLHRSPEYLKEVAAALHGVQADRCSVTCGCELLLAASDCRTQLELLLEEVPATPAKLDG
jgi:hypothetical protein